jgi:hypothetical protein
LSTVTSTRATGCADSGQLDGRTNPEINGCAIYGARQHAGRPMT